MRKAASLGSLILGAILIIGGAFTWFVVSGTLADQNIMTSEDACLPNNAVDGPFTAYCEAQVIEVHALQATDGLTYAELEREDPRRATAMNASFLRASLFTSVVAFGVAAMAAGMGVIFILIGLGMRDVAENLPRERVGAR
ncbi:MAG: aromatic ring-opening dioxygenase LigA [Acidimicrobiia bacterium]